MMRYLLFCSLLCAHAARALTPVPDANLRAWINANYPGAMVGNSVDENHPGVQGATSLNLSNSGIASLQGVQALLLVAIVEHCQQSYGDSIFNSPYGETVHRPDPAPRRLGDTDGN